MKILFVLLFFLSTVGLRAQSAYNKVAQTAEELRQAMVDAKVDVLNELTHDSLSYGHSSGLIENKQQFIEKLRTGRSDFVNIEISNQTIHLFKKTALIRHTLSGNIKDNGVAGTVKLYVLQVWQKQGRSWKLIARQAARAT